MAKLQEQMKADLLLKELGPRGKRSSCAVIRTKKVKGVSRSL